MNKDVLELLKKTKKEIINKEENNDYAICKRASESTEKLIYYVWKFFVERICVPEDKLTLFINNANIDYLKKNNLYSDLINQVNGYNERHKEKILLVSYQEKILPIFLDEFRTSLLNDNINVDFNPGCIFLNIYKSRLMEMIRNTDINIKLLK